LFLPGAISCVPLLQTLIKSQTCSAVEFLAKRKAMITPYLSTKLIQLGRTEDGRILQTFSNAASIAAADRLFPIALLI
jgi:hypothetical protein